MQLHLQLVIVFYLDFYENGFAEKSTKRQGNLQQQQQQKKTVKQFTI
jgi:hypothetical protein